MDETEYTETRLGPLVVEFPSEWDIQEMSELYHNSQIGTDERGDGDENVPLIKMGDLSIGRLDIEEPEEIQKDDGLLERYSLEEGDLLFNTRNSPELVGKTAVWDGRYPAVYDNNLLRIRLDSSISPRFLNYYLSSGVGWRQLKSRVEGTTSVAAIYGGELDKVQVPVPPVGEQERIASVLYTVDKHVEALDQRHSDLQDLKHALMQDLLTGQTRVTPDTPVRGEIIDGSTQAEVTNTLSSRVTKKTAIGKILVDWKVLQLGDVARLIGGKSFPTEHQTGESGGTPVIKVADMNNNYREMVQVENWVDDDTLDELGHNTAPEGSIILPKTGQAVLTNKRRLLTQESAFDNNLLAVVPEGVNSEYLFNVLRNIDMERYAQTGVVPSITQGMMDVFSIPVPPLWEQERIASVLYTVDEMIARTSELRDEYEHLKHGLMQDLLSGDNRTPETVEVLEDVRS